MNALKLGVVSVVLASAAFAAEATIVTQEATGQAAVGSGTEEKAFEEAKAQALRTAVEQAAGVIVQADTVTRNSSLLMDQVSTKAMGFVKKYDVLDKKVEKKVVTVKVKAEIVASDLEKEVAAVQMLIGKLGFKKVLIAVQEQSIDSKGVSSKSEILPTLITDAFKRDGWTIKDEKSTGDGPIKISAGVSNGAVDAKEITKRSDVDYIVYGTASFRYVPPGAGTLPELDDKGKQILFFVTGSYDLAMFETRTGTQLAKVAGEIDQKRMMAMSKKVVGYKEVAQEFCAADAPRIVSELRKPVIEYLRNADVNGNEVTVAVTGVPDLDTVEQLEKAFGAVDKVTKVTTGDFSGGKVEYTLAYAGTAKELGSVLKTKSVKKKKINVTGLMNNKVELSLGK